MESQIDPITLEVMRNALLSIADEMTAALVRTGYSTNIKDRRDCSCAIYTVEGEAVGLSELNTPVHLGTMHPVVETVLAKYPVDDLGPGDAIVTNLPYPAGPGHLNDIALVAPVYHDESLIALLANQAHHVDVGGFAPGSMPFGVTEIYQEGLQIPPVHIRNAGVLDEEIISFITQNVRTRFEVRGDLLAQIAALNVGERRLCELAEEYGIDVLLRYMAALLDYAERRMIAGIGKIPQGRYQFEDFLEGDGITDSLIRIRVSIQVAESKVRFDFEGTDPQVLGPLNCRWPSVGACVQFVMKSLIDPELPPNAGAYRPIEIVIPEGSLLDATFPAAVCNANIVTAERIVDVLLGAFLQAVPERVLAACSGTMNLLNIGGKDPTTGEYYSYVETYGGGQGAMHCQDGMDGVQNNVTNTRNAPVEVIESAYPLRVERYGLVPNSEGPGRHRGGVGLTREFQILGKEATITLSSDRARIGPWGVFGGGKASRSECTVISAEGNKKKLPSKVVVSVHQGDRIVNVTPGGGGWGDPLDRDPERVRWDVLEGLVSVDRAREIYGVVVDPTNHVVDREATTKLRHSLRNQRNRDETEQVLYE